MPWDFTIIDGPYGNVTEGVDRQRKWNTFGPEN